MDIGEYRIMILSCVTHQECDEHLDLLFEWVQRRLYYPWHVCLESVSIKSERKVHTYSDAISAARLIYRSIAQLLSTVSGGGGLLRTCSAHTDSGLCPRSRRKNSHNKSVEIGLQ